MILIELLHNVTLLVALSALSGFLHTKYEKTKHTGEILQGFLFGGVVILGMLNPLNLYQGVLIDGRMIVISLATFLFGPLTGLISSSLGIFFRMYVGGTGMLTGILLILTAHVIGLAVYLLKKNEKITSRKRTFFIIGLINGIAMLMLMETLPSVLANDTLKSISLSVVIFFPTLTLILGKILNDQIENINYLDLINEEKKLYQTTLLSIGDAVITTNTLGNITSMNPVAERLTEYSSKEAFGQPVSNILTLISETTGQNIECPIKKVLRDGIVTGIDDHTLLISKKGNQIPVADSAAPITTSDGEMKGAVIVFRDQIEERRKQKELTLSEARFRTIVEGAPEPIFICVNGKFAYLNPPALALFEVSKLDEIIGRHARELINSNIWESLDLNLDFPIRSDRNSRLIETSLSSLKGNKIWVEISGEPIEYNNEEGMLIFLRDIRERKAAEEKFSHLHHLMQYIIEHNRSAVAVHDKNLRYIYVSKRYLEEYQVKEEDIIGKHHYDVFPDLPEKWREVHRKALNGIVSNSEDDPYERADGTIEWTRWECRPWYESDGTIGGIIVYTEVITKRKKAEDLIKQNEQKLSSIFRAAPVGIGVVVNRVFADVNPRVCEISGYTREELIGNDSRMLYPTQEDYDYVGKEKYRLISEFGTGIVETKWKTKDNEIKIILLGSTPIDVTDLSKGVTFTALDISDSKKQELQLRESEEKFRRLFENHSAVKLIIDPDTGKIIDANDNAAEYYGWSKDELKSMKIQQINTLPEIQVKSEMEKVRARIKNYFEFRHRLKDGRIRDVEVYSSKINISGKDFYHSIVHDVTEKKKAENELQKRSQAVEQSPVSIVITDKEGVIEYVNPHFSKVSGYSHDEVIGKNPRLLKSGYHNKEFYSDLWIAIKSGENWNGIFRNKRKNGSLFWESAIISPIKDEFGSIVNYVAVKEDISDKVEKDTELQNYREHLETLVKQRTEELDRLNNDLMEQLKKEKELEQQLKNSLSKEKELNELKNKFIATVSHEFRTPLAALLSSSQLLQRYSYKWDPTKINEHYKRINTTINYLTRLLDDVLTISRSDREVLANNPEKINVEELRNDYHAEVKHLLSPNHKLTIINDCINNELFVDKKLLHHIMINLIANAIKYSPAGGEVRATIKSDKGRTELEVSDEGIGIPEEEIELIFDPFYRTTNSVGIQGSGLGLNVVKRCVEILKGTIEVVSSINKGTKFKINLPI